MVTAILREASCERGGRAAILVQYDSIFIEIALFSTTSTYFLKMQQDLLLRFTARPP